MNNNFGGLLQAYSLQKFINAKGYNVTTASYEDINIIPRNTDEKKLARIKKLIMNSGISLILNKLLKKIIFSARVDIKKKINNRNTLFAKFRKENIIHTGSIINDDNISEYVTEYDTFVCGSDLVWNIADSQYLQKGYWLTFEASGKRISYAASIPMHNLMESQKIMIKSALRRFDNISVREDVGKRLLEGLDTGKEIKHVVDPVFLLSKAEWGEFAQFPEWVHKKKYLLCYFLGEEKKYRTIAKIISKELKLDIVNIAHVNGFCLNDLSFGKSVIDLSLQNFVGLFKNAEIIITDSFHGVAFSMIFDKEFYPVERFRAISSGDLNERLNSLLRMTNSQNRMLDYKNIESSIRKFRSIHSEKINYEILFNKINESKIFIVDSLEN